MLHYRKAIHTDLEALNRLVNRAYRGESSKKGWTTEADLLDGQRTDVEMLREIIEAPASQILLAFRNSSESELLACVQLRDEGDGSCYLGMFTVDPELQNQGIGKLLMEESEKQGRGLNCKEMKMTVLGQRKELLAYYERRGYHITGKLEPFHADPRFGLPKVQDLFLFELKKAL